MTKRERLAAAALPPGPAAQKKRVFICRLCGKPGHMQKTCPDAPLPPWVTPAGEEPVRVARERQATRRGPLPSGVRTDLPAEHPIIIDMGGVEVVALEIGPGAAPKTSRVRWQAGPGCWDAAIAEVPHACILRDATMAEIEQLTDDPEVDLVEAAG